MDQALRRTAPLRTSMLPSLRQALVVLAITLALSLVLHAAAGTPYAIVFSRVGAMGAAMLLAYAAIPSANAKPNGWLKLAAVAAMAPLASAALYLLLESSNPKRQPSGYVALALLALVVGIIVASIALRFERHARERAERLQAELARSTLERELADARLRLLQRQIEPHFLFNTLANIEVLVESKSDNAGPVLRHLIAYLRAAMPRLDDADASLGGEVQLVRAYLELMHMRMPDRLRFSVDMPAELHAIAFPPMALLTLVENAVRHGIDPSTQGGRITVGGARDAASGEVTCWVADSGVGMHAASTPGTGLANLRSRLQAFYGGDARLDLLDADPHGVHAELIFQPRSTA